MFWFISFDKDGSPCINISKVVFGIVLSPLEVRCVVVDRIYSEKSNAVHFQ